LGDRAGIGTRGSGGDSVDLGLESAQLALERLEIDRRGKFRDRGANILDRLGQRRETGIELRDRGVQRDLGAGGALFEGCDGRAQGVELLALCREFGP